MNPASVKNQLNAEHAEDRRERGDLSAMPIVQCDHHRDLCAVSAISAFLCFFLPALGTLSQ